VFLGDDGLLGGVHTADGRAVIIADLPDCLPAFGVRAGVIQAGGMVARADALNPGNLMRMLLIGRP